MKDWISTEGLQFYSLVFFFTDQVWERGEVGVSEKIPQKFHSNFLDNTGKNWAVVKIGNKTFNRTWPIVKQVGRGTWQFVLFLSNEHFKHRGEVTKRAQKEVKKAVDEVCKISLIRLSNFHFLIFLQVAREFVKNERLFNKPELSFGYFVVYTPVRYY